MDEKLTNRMDEFFKSIAEQVNEMIPVVWNTFYLFGELADVLHPKSWTQDWRCSFYE